MALEAATRGIARTVVAISPACLWRKHGAAHVPIVFQGLRVMAAHFPGLLKTVVRNPCFVSWHWLSRSRWEAGACTWTTRVVRSMTSLSDRVRGDFRQYRSPFSAHAIAVPVTVAFGDRDWILTKGSRLRSALPTHARWVEKRGWGHFPMWVDPAGVAELILEGTRGQTQV